MGAAYGDMWPHGVNCQQIGAHDKPFAGGWRKGSRRSW